MTKIGIVICDRYQACVDGKCPQALWNREGAFTPTIANEEIRTAYDYGN